MGSIKTKTEVVFLVVLGTSYELVPSMTKNTTSGLFKSFYRLSLAPGGNLPKIIFSLKHNFMIYDARLDFWKKQIYFKFFANAQS